MDTIDTLHKEVETFPRLFFDGVGERLLGVIIRDAAGRPGSSDFGDSERQFGHAESAIPDVLT